MDLVSQSLASLKLGEPQQHENLVLFPLLAEADQPPGYVLLDDALERKLARVTEVSEQGRVPELAFENGSTEKVLLVDGDELVGAKQNRVLNLTILVPGGARIVIPVSCVEQGRWAWGARGFRTSEHILFARAQAKKMASVSESLRSTGTRRSNQGEVWDEVAQKMAFARASSASAAMSDAYAARSRELNPYREAFRPAARQRGAVLAIDGKVVGLELFDSAAAFARHHGKLVQSYALDALETRGGGAPAPSAEDVRAFIESLASAKVERYAALGEGEDLRLSGKGISGGALEAGGRLVHLAGFVSA